MVSVPQEEIGRLIRAVTELDHILRREKSQKEAFHLCMLTFRAIAQNGQSIAQHFPLLMKAVDSAILKIYPHDEAWDDDARADVLNGFANMLERLWREKLVKEEDIQDLLKFCNSILASFMTYREQRSQT